MKSTAPQRDAQVPLRPAAECGPDPMEFVRQAVVHTRFSMGFTLVELLVALCILSIVTSGTYMAFSTGLRLRGSLQHRREQFEGVSLLRTALRDDLFNLSTVQPHLVVQQNSMSLLRHPRHAYRGFPETSSDIDGKEPEALLVSYCCARRADNTQIVVRQERPFYAASNRGNLTDVLGGVVCDSADMQLRLEETVSPTDVERLLDAGLTLFQGCETLSLVPLQLVSEDLVEAPYGVQAEVCAIDVTPGCSALLGGSLLVDASPGRRNVRLDSHEEGVRVQRATLPGRQDTEDVRWRIYLP